MSFPDSPVTARDLHLHVIDAPPAADRNNSKHVVREDHASTASVLHLFSGIETCNKSDLLTDDFHPEYGAWFTFKPRARDDQKLESFLFGQ